MEQSEEYLRMAVAASTQRNYAGAVRSYRNFCDHHFIQAFPLIEDNLMVYASHVASYSSHSNIKMHLSAIKFVTIIQGLSFPHFQRRLYLLVRGIRRSQGKRYSLPQRAPVTPSLLREMYQVLFNSSRAHEDKLMLWASLTTAFFGFLRVSEYTSSCKTKFDPETTLLCADVAISGDVVSINIKASKTDPFRQGLTVRLAANGTFLCPLAAISHFLSVHPTREGPLFVFHNNKYLTPKDVNSLLADTTCGRANTTSHSLRIGAASTAAAMGCPKWLIQTLGRWSSDCYRTYLRLSSHTLINTSHVLANCSKANVGNFDPLE